MPGLDSISIPVFFLKGKSHCSEDCYIFKCSFSNCLFRHILKFSIWKRHMDDSQKNDQRNIKTNNRRLLLDSQFRDESSQMSHSISCNDILPYGAMNINNIFYLLCAFQDINQCKINKNPFN